MDRRLLLSLALAVSMFALHGCSETSAGTDAGAGGSDSGVGGPDIGGGLPDSGGTLVTDGGPAETDSGPPSRSDAGGDTVSPVVEITSPTGGAVLVPGLLLVQGLASDEGGLAKVQVALDDGAAVEATGASTWTARIDAADAADGTHTLTATAFDLAGNRASASVDVVIAAGAPQAVLVGLPRDPSCLVHGPLRVAGAGIVSYRSSLDASSFGPETPVATRIALGDLQPGSSHTLRVVGKKADGSWQQENSATRLAWTVPEGKYTRFSIDAASATSSGHAIFSPYVGVLGGLSQVYTSHRGNDRIAVHLKVESGSLDLSKIKLRWQHQGRTESVPLSSYVTPSGAWKRVEVPLSDISNEPDRRLATSSVGLLVLPGAGKGVLAVDELRFTGGPDDFLWLGDANPPSLEAGAFQYVAGDATAPAVISVQATPATGGYRCADPVEAIAKLRPADPALAALYDAERASVTSSPVRTPGAAHPRLFGDDARWQASFDGLDGMACVPGSSGWGRLPDLKDNWDLITLGVRPCRGEAPKPLADHRDAGFYLTIRSCLASPPGGDPANCPAWSDERGLRTLHLIRRLRACQAAGRADCWYSKADTDALVAAFVSWELERLPTQVWHRTSPDYFDLGAEPAFRFWCLLLDTLWNEPSLLPAHRQAVRDQLDFRIDWFLEQYKVEHGTSMFNGNNWTPVVALGGLWWALTFLQEDPRAPRVLEVSLDILWGHRRFYLADGSYMEGASTYVGASVGSLLGAQALLGAGFGARLQSPDWERVALARHWILEHIAPDGRGVDFGDAWAGKGGGLLPLQLLLLPEVLGDAAPGSTPLSQEAACLVRQVAANLYYDGGFDDVWSDTDLFARDWASLGRTCPLDLLPGPRTQAFPDGGVAMLRARVPGATALARAATNPEGGTDPGPDNDRELFYQADETFLAISAIPNEFPHREKDVGAILWTAFGSRLLWDWGYGDIKGGTSYLTEQWDLKGTADLSDDTVALDRDYFPSAANTLVVEDALVTNTTTYPGHAVLEDFNQLTGLRATLATCRLGATLDCTGAAASGFHAVHVDASAVYGAGLPAAQNSDGWMDHVSRYVVLLHDGGGAVAPATDPLVDGDPWNDGHLLVVDSFAAKAARGPVSVAEHFFTRREDLAQSAACLSDCSAACLADCKAAPCPATLGSPERLAWCAPGCLDDCGACTADCVAPACTSEVQDTVPKLVDAATVEILPRCAMLDDRGGAQPESRGRILAASRRGGGFALDPEPITFRNRTNGIERRHRFRYRPSAPALDDVRVFLLLAGRQDLTPPAASVTHLACGTGSVCFDVTVAGQTKRVTLQQQSGHYLLSKLE